MLKGAVRLLLHAGSAIIAFAHPVVGRAQQAPSQPMDRGIADIVVTATKRAEPLAKVPIAASVVDANALAARGIAKIDKMEQVVPNMRLTSTGPQATASATFIRGIGQRGIEPSNDPPNATSIDGVYTSTVTAGMLDTFDTERIEILRGPQGTLQGRNATGGAILLVTRRPDPSAAGPSAEAELSYASFETVTAKVRMETPLVEDRLAVKAAFLFTDGNGYIKHTDGGPDKGALSYMFARIGLLFEPSDALSLYVSADTLHDRTRQGFNVPQNSSASHPRPQTQDQLQPLICSLFGRCTPEKRYSYSANYTPRNNSDSSGVSANISYDAGPLTLTSITGYRAIRDTSNSDLDGTDIPLVQVENRRLTFDEVSSELRLSSNPGGGLDFNETLDWILGGYYFHQKFHLVQPVALPALGLPIGPDNPAGERRQTTDSIAVFANANLNLSDRLTLFGGMRYQRDEKQGQGVSPAFSQRTFTNSDVVFEGGVRYSLSSQVNSYFRFAQATRTGGFTAFGTTFDPEKVDSYEIGVKLQSHDRRFSLNTAAFYYDYRNLQRDVTVAIPVAPFFQETVLNAANSRIWGIEAEMSARPVDTITISGFVGYLNTKYKDYFDTDPDTGEIADNSALRMPYAPRLTAGGSLNVDFTPVPLQSLFDRGTILIDGNYMSAQTTTTTDSPIADQKAYAVFNASIKMSAPDDRFYAQLFVDNVFDQFYLTNGENVTNLALFRVEGRPRSAGIRFGFKL